MIYIDSWTKIHSNYKKNIANYSVSHIFRNSGNYESHHIRRNNFLNGLQRSFT